MIKIIKSELVRYFVGGFAVGTIALFAVQPMETRAEIQSQITGLTDNIPSQQG